MDKLVALVSSAPKTRVSNDDDFADRLSSRYSVVLLVVFSILVGMNQYVRNPITCWTPVHFTGSHTKFATSYCWVKNTYYLPWEREIPKELEPEKRQMIPYYQWIPFILLTQALMFYIPTLIWHGLNSKAGVDADNIMAAAHTFSRTDKVDSRDRTLKMLANQIDRFLCSRDSTKHCLCDLKSIVSSTCCRLCGRRLGNYLLVLFLFHKVVYIGNVIGQLFLLNVILSTRYTTFGVDLVKNMVEQKDWTEEGYVAFPRVTLCDFKVRGQDMTNVHRYTIQCVLPVNLYNEKIYVFLWYWMIIVAALSVASFMVWLLRAIFFRDRLRFVSNHVKLGKADKEVDNNPERAKAFTQRYLQQDGAFLLRLIAHNTNNITTTEVTCALWDLWWDRERAQMKAAKAEEELDDDEDDDEDDDDDDDRSGSEKRLKSAEEPISVEINA